MKIQRMCKPKARILAAVATTLLPLSASVAHAEVLFYDGYEVSAQSNNIDFENNLRQTGTVGTLTYAQSPAFGSGTDWQSQVGNNGVPGGLLIVSGGPGGNTLVSPNHNFDSMPGGASALQIAFDLAMTNPNGYQTTGFSVGSSSVLTPDYSSATSNFCIRFVGAGTNAFQFFDGGTQVGPNYFPSGVNLTTGASILLDIFDMADNSPWDGVGSTTINVSVNGSFMGGFTKTGGGYTDNFITMMGLQSAGDVGIGINRFDNLSFSAVPEPTSALAGLLVAAGLLRRRRDA